MSFLNFLIFEKNVREKDIYFKFLNLIYFSVGYSVKLSLGTFWDILVHFLKVLFRNFGQVWSFVPNLIFSAKKRLLVSHKTSFIEKEAA